MFRPLLLSLLFAVTTPVLALDHYWSGTTGNSWVGITNWTNALTGGSTPAAVPGSADTAIFNANGSLTDIGTLGADQAALGLVFNSNASGGITLGTLNDFILTLGTGGINVQSGTQTINSTLTVNGNQSWTNTGAGTLNVGGNINLNANLTLAGTSDISITGGISALADRTITLSNAGTVSLGTVNSTATQTFNTATGTNLIVNGIVSGANMHKDGAGTLTFNGANSFTGNLRILNGTVKVNTSNTVGGQLIFGNASGGAGSNGLGTLTLDDNTAVTFRLGALVYVHPTSDGAIINTGGGGTATSVLGLFGDRTFIVNETAAAIDLLVEAGIANGDASARSVTKQSIGTMVMRGVNTYTGATTVDRGKLVLDYSINNSDSRLSNSSTVNLRGGTLELSGNASAATSETALSLTMSRANSTLSLVSNGGQNVTMNFTNGLVRATSAGVVNFVTNDASKTLITVGGGLANGSTGILGGWATFNGDRWATRNGSNEIVALAGTVQNDKQLWTAADHVVIDGATTGALQTGEISSLILDSASGGTVTLDNAGSALTLTAAALLVSADAGANDTALTGGQLMTKQLTGGLTTEMIVTNLSNGTFTLGTNLGSNNTPQTSTQHLTLAGPGLINLTGSNHNLNGNTAIQGQVRLSGGNALNDYSTVTLATGSQSTVGALLDLNGGTEGVGGLAGGAGGDDTYAEVGRGEVRLGTGGTLIINQLGATTLSARITGSGATLVKRGSATFTTNNVEHSMTGEVRVLGGLLDMTGASTGFVNLNTLRLRGGQVRAEQNSATSSINKLNNNAALILEGTSGDGFRVTSNQNTTRTESVGSLSLAGSANTMTLDNTAATTTLALTTFGFNSAISFARSNDATLLVRGPNLGGSPTAITDATRVTFTNATAINAQLIGTSTTAGVKNLKVLAFATGDNSPTGVGNTFLTVDSTVGNSLRTLADSEYETDYAIAASDDNLSLSATAATLATKTVNALRINNSAGSVSLTGDVGSTLTLTSGGLLVTAGATDNDVVISGYDAIRAGTSGAGNDELIAHVTSSHATASGATLTLQSAITDNGGATSLTKSGNGTLILGGSNNYTGSTTVNQGVLEFGAATGNLGSGTVRVSGGTLRWGAGNTTDISAGRSVELLGASVYVTTGSTGNIFGVGSTFDVGANNVTLASSIGNNGYGGLTKLGAGSLTLSAAPTYTGPTVISQGSMTFASIAANTTEALHLIQTAGITSGTVSATITSGLNVQSMIVGGVYGSGPGMTASVTVGGGAVTVGDGGGDDFLMIGYRDATATQATNNHSGSVNFSAASTVDIHVSRILMGIYTGIVPNPNSRTSTGSLTLSNGTNVITAGSILMGSSPASVVNTGTASTLNLGTGSTTINVDSFTIGGIRSKADVTIGAGGSFTLRGQQGGSTGANLFIGDNDATGTGTPNLSTLNLAAASSVDMKVNLLVLGRLGASTNGGYGQGVLTFGVGSLEADTIRMADANYTSAGTNPVNTKGTLNQTGTATVRFRDLSQGAGEALYNWQGGTIGTLSNASLTNQNVPITLNGALSATDPTVRSFSVESGRTATFQSAALLAGTGSYTKTGAGELIFQGTNTHSGNLLVSSGKVTLHTNGSINDVAWVNLDTGTMLDISPRSGAAYTSDAVISGTGTLGGTGTTFTVGSSVGSVNSAGVLKPGSSSLTASLASAATVGDQTGTLSVQGNLILAAGATRAALQVGSTDRSAAASYSLYASTTAWVDDLPNQHASFMTGAGTGHDLIAVSGSLTLNNTGLVSVALAGSYQGVFGDVFNLFDWTLLDTTYTDNGFLEGDRTQTGSELGLDLDLPTLGGGLLWDTSLFLTQGVVVVVPEPQRAFLLFFGSLLFFRRRRP